MLVIFSNVIYLLLLSPPWRRLASSPLLSAAIMISITIEIDAVMRIMSTLNPCCLADYYLAISNSFVS
jgi:hypothetical protein